MNGDLLISKVRSILKDEETPTDLGVEWTDREILLALNSSQDILCDFFIKSDAKLALKGLVRTFATPTNIQPIPLPANYMHYIAARLTTDSIYYGDSDSVNYWMSLPSITKSKLAKIYIGGESSPFLNNNHTACFIIGNNIYVNDYFPLENTALIFTYWSYPSYIGATSQGDNLPPAFATVDFGEAIYDLMVEHASVTLSMKEPQTIRDVKFFKMVAEQLGLGVIPSANYQIEGDAALKVIKEIQKQQGGK